MKRDVEFRTDPISPEQFIDVLVRSGLAERRPVDQPERIQRMLEQADLTLTAWDRQDGRLIGVARLLTDWVYIAYLSELAVDKVDQGRGVGTALIEEAKRRVGPGCSFLLLAAPDAAAFYEGMAMPRAPDAFLVRRDL